MKAATLVIAAAIAATSSALRAERLDCRLVVFSDKDSSLSSTRGLVQYGLELRGSAWG
jgi:hypothetical protein